MGEEWLKDMAEEQNRHTTYIITFVALFVLGISIIYISFTRKICWAYRFLAVCIALIIMCVGLLVLISDLQKW